MLDIVSSAACAASEMQGDCREVVEKSLRMGRWAAAHGRCLPLPLLLDANAASRACPQWDLQPRPTATFIAAASSYDAWVMDFCADMRRTADAMPTTPEEEAAPPQSAGVLAPLMHRWPEPNGGDLSTCREWFHAYDALVTTPGGRAVAAILGRWAGPRSGERGAWESVWKEGRRDPTSDDRPAKLWSLFSREGHHPTLHESVDHHAAWLYFTADPYRPLADQERRIRRIRLVQGGVSWPLVESYEQLDPHYGQWAISVLVSGEYGEFRIVNGTADYMNTPPRNNPPRRAEVHLGWFCGYAAVSSRRPVAAPAAGDSTRRLPVTLASSVQAVTGLLLNDWRRAFAWLPVDFSLHRLFPAWRQIALGRAGRPWDEDVCAPDEDGRGRRTVPRTVARDLLRRQTTAESWGSVPEALAGQKMPASRACWCCVVVAAEDLADLRFHPVNEDTRPAAGGAYRPEFECDERGCLLPGPTSHVIVLDGPVGPGRVLAVRRAGDSVRLHRLPQRPAGEDAEETPIRRSFTDLRTQAMDVLIGEMERRMC